MMVRLNEVQGLGSKRAELPDGKVIEYDGEADIEQRLMARGIRSACAVESCRSQSAPGSRHCAVHLAEIIRPNRN